MEILSVILRILQSVEVRAQDGSICRYMDLQMASPPSVLGQVRVPAVPAVPAISRWWSPEVSPFESPRGQLWSGYIRWIAAFRSCDQSWVFSLSLVPCYSPGIVCRPMFARRCCAIPDAWFEPCIPYSDNLDAEWNLWVSIYDYRRP